MLGRRRCCAPAMAGAPAAAHRARRKSRRPKELDLFSITGNRYTPDSLARRALTRRMFARHCLQAGAFLSLSAAGLSAKFSASQVGANTAIDGLGLFEAIAVLKRLGFNALEFHPMGTPVPTPGEFPGFKWNTLEAAQRTRLKEALKSFPYLTAHLPYRGINYFSTGAAEAAKGIATVDEALEGSLWLGAKTMVIHPLRSDRTFEQHLPVMVKEFRRWGDRAAKSGARLALETGYPSSVKEFVTLIREINHPAVGATLDVGHQKTYTELLARVKPEEKGTPKARQAYNDVNIELVRQLGEKLIHLHIHDIDPATWQEHKPMETGFVDYPRLLSELAKVNYKGLFIFEIGGDPKKMEGYLRDGKRKFEGFL